MSSLSSAMECVLLSSFPKPKSVVTIPSTATVAQAVEILQKAEILAAPVYDATIQDVLPWTQKYLGVIDLHSILNSMLGSLEKSNQETDFRQQLLANASLASQAVTSLLTTRSDDFAPFVALYEDSNLMDVALLLGKLGLPRVYVVQRDGDIVNAISQRVVVQRLIELQASAKFALGGTTLSALGLANAAASATLSLKNCPLDGFRILRDKNLDSIPIVDANGKIVSDLNIKSAKHLVVSPDAFKFIHLPFEGFADKLDAAVVVTGASTLSDVLAIIMKQNVRVLYVVDAQGALVRVLPLADVIAAFMSNIH